MKYVSYPFIFSNFQKSSLQVSLHSLLFVIDRLILSSDHGFIHVTASCRAALKELMS